MKRIRASLVVLGCSLAVAAPVFSQPGSVDLTFDPGSSIDNTINSLALQPDGKAVVGGLFTLVNQAARNRIARLLSNGGTNISFDPGTGADANINALAIQPDGRIVIGGGFTSINGTNRSRVARLNADGSLDVSFNPGSGANSTINALALQSDGKVIITGTFTNFNGTNRSRIARLNSNGSLDTSFNPGSGVNATIFAVVIQANGQVVIGGLFDTVNGTNRNGIARLNTNGSLDPVFNPGSGVDVSATSISALALQADGRIAIGGSFTNFNGTNRNRIARLNTNGTLDASFNPGSGANSGTVLSVVVSTNAGQTNLFIGGSFTNYNGTGRNGIARLNTNGSLDLGFDPGAGANITRAVAVQSDGKVMIAGSFTSAGGSPRFRVARLNTDGSLDTGFANGTPGPNNYVSALGSGPSNSLYASGAFTTVGTATNRGIVRLAGNGSLFGGFNSGTNVNTVGLDLAVQPDGKAVIGFSAFSGSSIAVRRLNADGTVDTGFTNGVVNGPGVGVFAVALDPSPPIGRILVAGEFTTYNGSSRFRIARLNASGTVDGSFLPGAGANSSIFDVAVQPDGRVLIGGQFTNYNLIARNRIARINADGSLDGSFVVGFGADSAVTVVTLQPDGRVLIGGFFTNYNGTTRNGIARILPNGFLDPGFDPGTGVNGAVQAIALSGNKILIGGSFSSYNGTNRNNIARLNSDGSLDLSFDPGTGTDSTVNAILVQPDGQIVIGGDFRSVNGVARDRLARLNGESGLYIITQPQDLNAPQGSLATFSVTAGGTAPFSYQWRKNGTNIPGANASTLSFGSVQPADAGDYQVVVSNVVGSVASRVARLDVIEPPVITVQPMSQSVTNGATNVSFTVSATGTAPLRYQWRLNGVNIAGATNSTYTIPVVNLSHGGNYTVAVENGAGAITSMPTLLTVVVPVLPAGNNFANRTTISNLAGVVAGTNSFATKEAGEPDHAGQAGGASVWYKWTAPSSGVVTFHTVGSAFDTLLAVYTGTNVASLTEIASSDDNGGFATSLLRFNAQMGTNYQIAIDGFAGASGRHVLSWALTPTASLLPVITSQPQSQAVSNGATVLLSVGVTNGFPFKYQWRFYATALPGKTNATLSVTGLQPTNVGDYTVAVTNSFGLSVTSAVALLEISTGSTNLSRDKLEEGSGGGGGGFAPFGGPGKLAGGASGPILVSAGTLNSQNADTRSSTTQSLETNHCGVIGGASRWFTFQPQSGGVFIIDTIGSSIDTVLAVYTGNSFTNLTLVACDSDSAPDYVRSLLSFDAQALINYQVVVDGENNEKGPVTINYRLGQPAVFSQPATNAVGLLGGNVTLNFTGSAGNPPATYQWRLNGNNLPGQTGPALTLSGLQGTENGTYELVTSNFIALATNAVAFLEIQPVLVGLVGVTNNLFMIPAIGVQGHSYVLEVRTNLTFINWVPFQTNVAPAGGGMVFSNGPVNFINNRTYRVRKAP